MRRVATIVALLVSTALLAGCGATPAAPTSPQGSGATAPTSPKGSGPSPSGELIIYSGRNEQFVKPLIDRFEKETGIRVTLRAGSASELASAILEEANRPRADLFIANDAGALELLRMKGALEPNNSAAVARVPADLRAPDGAWVGISGRTRVIMYNTNLVKESELPRSWSDLTDPKWKGQIAMATSQNESVTAQVTAMRLTQGDQATEAWLKGLLANKVKTLNGHTAVRQAVGKGEFKLGIVNNYYFHLEKQAGSPVGVVIPDQDANAPGTLMNVAGAGLIKGAKNLAAARRFVDFLLTPESQKVFAEVNFEIPVLPGVPVAPGVTPIDRLKRMNVPLSKLGSELERTVKLLEKVGLP